MKETSIDVIKGIIEDMGGTSTARGMVRVLKELRQVLSGGSSGAGGSSGGGAMVVNATIAANEQTGATSITAQKTFAEIYGCLQGGGDVIVVAEDPLGENLIARPFVFSQSVIAFALVAGNNDSGFSVTAFSMLPDDSIVAGYGTIETAPAPDPDSGTIAM